MSVNTPGALAFLHVRGARGTLTAAAAAAAAAVATRQPTPVLLLNVRAAVAAVVIVVRTRIMFHTCSRKSRRRLLCRH